MKCLRISLLFIPFLFYFNVVSAQNNEFNINNIDNDLFINAKAVIRNNEKVLEIIDQEKAVLNVKYTISILNKNGIPSSKFIQFYDKFSKIKHISATCYDEFGNKLKKIHSDDIKDYSAISGYSIYDDNRVKYIDPEIKKTPFTIEYEYKIVYNGILNFPAWILYPDYNISTEKTSFKVIIPDDMSFHYYLSNLSIIPEIINEKSNQIYRWDTTNLKAIDDEPLSPDLYSVSPKLLTAPSTFKIENFEGSMESWNSFGLWLYELNRTQNTLSEETRDYILNKSNEHTNTIDKIRFIYEYVQDKTRYVSIQIGIGGWQPFDAEKVDRLSYGDCKALTNYTHTLLNVIGIESYYTVVKAGKNTSDLILDFPSNQFNHAILCVPVEQDTIWLECTNQQIPFGYLGTFTDDRDVLIVKNNGGEISHTKNYSKNQNQITNNIVYDFFSNGSAACSMNTCYSGVEYDKVHYLMNENQENQKKELYELISIENKIINEFRISEEKEIIPQINIHAEMDINKCATVYGERIIFDLNILKKDIRIPKNISERITPFVFKREYTITDTAIFNIPKGYSINFVPKNDTIKSTFGKYSTQFLTDTDQLIYIRTYIQNKGVFDPAEYDDFLEFIKSISRIDNSKIILNKIS